MAAHHLEIFDETENSLSNDILTLPKKKAFFSFSEFATWLGCEYNHFLKYVEKINLDTVNKYNEYGHEIHGAIEFYLINKQFPDFDALRASIIKKLEALNDETIDCEEWAARGEPTVRAIPEFLNENFPGWELVATEKELLVDSGYEKYFKGYIDAVIKAPDPVTGKMFYWIIDWKTCESFWAPQKKRDPKKWLQLVFYKHYFALSENISPDEIKCAFVMLRRKVPKTSTQICELYEVVINKPITDSALDQIDNFMFHVKKGYKQKNRTSCTYCVYYRTEHCT